MQYNRDEKGNLTPLPKPSIDTGMGLERITAVMQGVHSNYDIDLFRSIIARIEELSGKSYKEDEKIDISMRAIADHARAMAFLIADGVLPSNEGRGYVLRRVMRRASRHAKLLGFNEPVLYKISDKVIDLMGNAYPELVEKRAYIVEVVKNEEERFLLVLESGLRLIEQEIEKHKKEKTPWVLAGEVAFKLYDTYGFPLDLTQAIGRDRGFVVDVEGFEREMEKQRERARAHWRGTGAEQIEAVYKKLWSDGIRTEFTGYQTLHDRSKVLALIKDGKVIDSIEGKEQKFQLIAQKTPFYGEAGGQVGDKGLIKGEDFEALVLDTQKPLTDLIVHQCQLVKGKIKTGDEIELVVNEEQRKDTARHHTATHLLHASLRKVLGEHVQQKGSLVAPDRLRFDFTHFSALSPQELEEVERLVNQAICANYQVRTELLPYKEALARGAIAIFEEKYGEIVRLVEINDFSRELCGGTHCQRTGDIGFFKIVSEGSVSAGVRRIEALAGRWAVEFVQKREKLIKELAQKLKSAPDELDERISKLLSENKQLRQKIKELETKPAGPDVNELLKQAKNINGITVLSTKIDIKNPKAMLDFSDRILSKLNKGILVLGSKDGEKAHIVVRVTKDISKTYNAGEIIKRIVEMVGGRGGGRPDLAQGGGTKPENLEKALKQAYNIISQMIKAERS